MSKRTREKGRKDRQLEEYQKWREQIVEKDSKVKKEVPKK